MDFPTELHWQVARVESGLDRLLPEAVTRPARLHTAMRYSIEAGGKRLRPVLVLAAADLWRGLRSSGGEEDPLPAAVAVECVHTYSLIHDDLPCMDNDDLRRGRPTAHKAFDEATALLAGDALLTHAFFLLAKSYSGTPHLAQSLTLELAEAAGSRRLIGGQMEDLLAEKKADASADDLEFIHRNKTAALIAAALVIGGRVGGAEPAQLATLRQIGEDLGLAFQVIDDVLDATADSATLGKTAGKDAAAGKATYVKLHGLDYSRQIARERSERALATLPLLPGDSGFLAALITQLVGRAR